jgi:raffinose/stachyose/melibiose transport system substrate-binding protein
VTIHLWHHFTPEAETKAMQDLADRFHAANPNVTIDITVVGASDMVAKTNAAMQANEPPDIFSGWGGAALGNYVDSGLVKDLTDAFATDGWKDTFLAGPLALYTLNDRIYGVPIRAGAWGLWYDSELFAKAAITGCPATWSDLLTDVRALKAAKITPIALGGKDLWPTGGWWQYLAIRVADWNQVQATATLFKRTGSFTDAPFVKAGDLLSELVALEPFQNGYKGASYDDQLSLAANGKAAMTLDGWWGSTWISSAGTDQAATKARLRFCPFPAVDGGAGNPADVMGSGNGFAIGRDAPPQAIDFLRFITSQDEYRKLVQSNFAAPPVLAGMESLVTDPNVQLVIKMGASAPHFAPEWNQSLGPVVGNVLIEQSAAVMAGATTGQKAAQAIEDATKRATNQ